MSSQTINYETLCRVSDAISSAKDVDELTSHIVHSLKQVLGLAGCALLLWDRRTDELVLAASSGLSRRYLDKGPLSARRSLSASLREGPVAIFDAGNDPRLQYPAEARAEGIRSILSVPVIEGHRTLGSLRLYSAEPWVFAESEITFAQAVAEIVALVLDNIRLSKGLKSSLEVIEVLRGPLEPVEHAWGE